MEPDNRPPWEDDALHDARRNARHWQEPAPLPRPQRHEEARPAYEPTGSHEPPQPYRDPWLTGGWFARLAEDDYAEMAQRRQPPKRGLFRRFAHWLAAPFSRRRPDRARKRH
jgi:hypothetical protein